MTSISVLFYIFERLLYAPHFVSDIWDYRVMDQNQSTADLVPYEFSECSSDGYHGLYIFLSNFL